MQDLFGRSITYLRVSVTDRCDFRCVYCMAEHMTFLPRQDVLSLEELERLCLAFIETMPLGGTGEARTDRYLPLSLVRGRLERDFTLTPSSFRTGGPARYYQVAETGGKLGLITPLTHNFCESCNRVRLTCTGK